MAFRKLWSRTFLWHNAGSIVAFYILMLDKVAIRCFTAVHHAIDYKVFLKEKKTKRDRSI